MYRITFHIYAMGRELTEVFVVRESRLTNMWRDLRTDGRTSFLIEDGKTVTINTKHYHKIIVEKIEDVTE